MANIIAPKKRKYALPAYGPVTHGSEQPPAKVLKHRGTITQCRQCLSTIASTTNTSSSTNNGMLTRGSTTSASRNAVFNTLELLEAILLQLPLRQVIKARRVNNHWNAVVLTSVHLRRMLFLLPEVQAERWVFDIESEVLKKSRSGDKGRQAPITVSKLNPLLFKEQKSEQKRSLVQRSIVCESLHFLARPDLANQSAIYHDMQVCMPPVNDVEFELHYEKFKVRRYLGDSRVRLMVHNRRGVTFGDIIRTFLAAVGPGTTEQPSSGYSIKVQPSRLWMLGVMFATENELEKAEGGSK